jgi:threonine/homoserine/homoserine lactone efflux protein
LLSFATDTFSLLRGIAVGLILAIPVGPTAILCMRRTLERGARFGFATGLGASLADGFYGAVTAFGIAAIQTFLGHHFVSVRLVGGLFMLGLAVRLVLSSGAPKKPVIEKSTSGRAVAAMVSGFLLTVTNPMTLFGFAAIFTFFHVSIGRAYADPDTFLVLGVILGSALWWFGLTLGVRRLRHLLSDQALHRINLSAAAFLAIFGAYALWTVAVKVFAR